MKRTLARIIRKYIGDMQFRKKLPKEFGSASVFLVPKADMWFGPDISDQLIKSSLSGFRTALG